MQYVVNKKRKLAKVAQTMEAKINFLLLVFEKILFSKFE